MVNPFAEKQDLINISTVKTAPRDITLDQVKVHEVGEQCYATFKDARLEKDPPTKKFHDPIATNKLKISSDLCKKKELKSNWRVVVLKADRSPFFGSHHSNDRAQSQWKTSCVISLDHYPGLCLCLMDY